jgi:hypothetical protein
LSCGGVLADQQPRDAIDAAKVFQVRLELLFASEQQSGIEIHWARESRMPGGEEVEVMRM